MNSNNLFEENKRLQERISELEAILDSVPTALYINQIEDIKDIETGKNIWSNKFALEYGGYSQEEATSLGARYFEKVIHPDDQQCAEYSINYLLSHTNKTNPEIFKSLNRVLKHKRDFCWNYIHTSVFKTKPDGTPWQFINVSMELTEYQHTITQLDDALNEIRQLKNQAKLQCLTKRELEILKFIALGLTDDEIAQKAFISKHTAHTHRNRIVRKLNVPNTASLVAFAVKCGLI